MKLVTTTRTKHYVKNFDYIRMTNGEKCRIGHVVRTFSPKTKEPMFIIEDQYSGHTTQIKNTMWNYAISLNDEWHKVHFHWHDRDVNDSNVLVYYKTKETVDELSVGDVLRLRTRRFKDKEYHYSDELYDATIVLMNRTQLVVSVSGKFVTFDTTKFQYDSYTADIDGKFVFDSGCSLRA